MFCVRLCARRKINPFIFVGSMMFHLANHAEPMINPDLGMVYITHLWSYYVILRMVYGILLKMVIFHSYVKLPEGRFTTLPLMDSEPRLMIRCTR
jgi:hypothetical protein